MKSCGDCINYGTCRQTCNVVRKSDICSSFLWKLSCDGCKYDSDRFSDICYHDCIMFSEYQKEDISIPKEKPMKDKVIFNNKQEVIEMFNSIGYTISPENLNALKRQGYIRKDIAEEAEEILRDWKAGHTTDINDMVVKAIEAIQYLKSKNERLNNAIHKS